MPVVYRLENTEDEQFIILHAHKLGACRKLWGECEQAKCILATEERVMYQMLLSLSEVTIVVGSLWWHIFGSSLAGSMAGVD